MFEDQVLGTGVWLLMAAMLLNSAVSKLVAPERLKNTLTELGFASLARPLAHITPVTEVLAAFTIVFIGGQAAGIMISLLGVSFAAAGFLGLRAVKDVECNCFGGNSGTTLGWRQIALLPAWVLAAVIVPTVSPSGLESSLTSLSAALAIAALFSVWRLSKPVLALRRFRKAVGI